MTEMTPSQEAEQERDDIFTMLRYKIDIVRQRARRYQDAVEDGGEGADEVLDSFCSAAEDLKNRIRDSVPLLESDFEEDFSSVEMGIWSFLSLYDKRALRHEPSLCNPIISMTTKLHDDLSAHLSVDEEE